MEKTYVIEKVANYPLGYIQAHANDQTKQTTLKMEVIARPAPTPQNVGSKNNGSYTVSKGNDPGYGMTLITNGVDPNVVAAILNSIIGDPGSYNSPLCGDGDNSGNGGNGPGYGMDLIPPTPLPTFELGMNWSQLFGGNQVINLMNHVQLGQKLRIAILNDTGASFLLYNSYYGIGSRFTNTPCPGFIGYTLPSGEFITNNTDTTGTTIQDGQTVYFDFVFLDNTEIGNGNALQCTTPQVCNTLSFINL